MKQITKQECEAEFHRIIDNSPDTTLENIRVDYEDLQTVLSNRKLIMSAELEASDIDQALKKLQKKLEYLKAKNLELTNAGGVLVQFTVRSNIDFISLAELMESIHENTNDDADVIWGTTIDDTLNNGHIKLNIVVAY